MISHLPKHILTLVPLSVLLIFPSLGLAIHEHYTLFTWLAVFTCIATLIFHLIVGIITTVSFYRHPERWDTTDFSIVSPYSEKGGRAPWSAQTYTPPSNPDFELGSPTSPAPSSFSSKRHTIRYYSSGCILVTCILLVFWLTSLVICISDTAKGPGSSDDTMTVNAPWNRGVQVTEIIFLLFESITMGLLAMKCVMVKRRMNAKRALVLEERKFNLPRSRSVRTPPSVPAWNRIEEIPLPARPELTVPARSRFSTDTTVGMIPPSQDRTLAISSRSQVTESKYASLRNIQTAFSPASGSDSRRSPSRVRLGGLLRRISGSSKHSSPDSGPAQQQAAMSVTQPSSKEAAVADPGRKQDKGKGRKEIVTVTAVALAETLAQVDTTRHMQSGDLASSSLDDLIRQAASTEAKIRETQTGR
ncbi:hypothetical protein D9758_010696 [Tetrapyrgos nigripes]|uniref:Uncharacterized protein n=1 Tax=Tetrapyrgos nigripes TaxID=182062 RepID=A0A8H5GG81_9AGAR|nr:hypothetical protein D9758_010696 [Tetrapyrgos nigripes]